MANPKDVVLAQLQTSQFLIDKFIADLTDAEYFKPPVQNANHTAWILGHIAVSEDSMVGQATGSTKRLPQATQDLFKGGSKPLADASKYPSRKEIDTLFRNSRAHTIEALKMFPDSKWNETTPEGGLRQHFPTLGSLWGLIGSHAYWHIGQLTVCRQAMKKPQVLM